ncbi:hypothetical protein PSTG_07924 [Puccinia striiformis f. sp. tritici PST-78]|uniref:Uncharacterized protein n=1 Tax=Puccinia striiformis f. sp. tritici PST-78 TaxID=1165861 RepID=A0A0L0VHH2_9BASI|nr:hypothetical protein PSTG_07924 [Puccinia striiformis f. sp. tritici PST-78]
MLDLALVQRPAINNLISLYQKNNRASQKGKKKKSKSKKGKTGSGQSQVMDAVWEANEKKAREMEIIFNDNWNLFEWIHKLLEKFEQALIDTQGKFYATLTIFIPWYKVLTDDCNQTIKKFTKSVLFGPLPTLCTCGCFGSAFQAHFFEQQRLDKPPEDDNNNADTNSKNQIQFKDEALKILRVVFKEYSLKRPVKQKSKSDATGSDVVSKNKKEKEQFHPLQNYKKTS